MVDPTLISEVQEGRGVVGPWREFLRRCPSAAHPQHQAKPPCLPTDIHDSQSLPISARHSPPWEAACGLTGSLPHATLSYSGSALGRGCPTVPRPFRLADT